MYPLVGGYHTRKGVERFQQKKQNKNAPVQNKIQTNAQEFDILVVYYSMFCTEKIKSDDQSPTKDVWSSLFCFCMAADALSGPAFREQLS